MGEKFLDVPLPVETPLPHDLDATFLAHRYQGWIMDTIRPLVGRRVLEVGAGCGAMSR